MTPYLTSCSCAVRVRARAHGGAQQGEEDLASNIGIGHVECVRRHVLLQVRDKASAEVADGCVRCS